VILMTGTLTSVTWRATDTAGGPRLLPALVVAAVLVAAPAAAGAQACLGLPLGARAGIAGQLSHASGADDWSITELMVRGASTVAEAGPLDLAVHAGLGGGRSGTEGAGVVRLEGGATAILSPLPRTQLCGGATVSRGIYDTGDDLTHTTVAAVGAGSLSLDLGAALLSPYASASLGWYWRDVASTETSSRDLFVELGANVGVGRYFVGGGLLLRHFEYRNQTRLALRAGLTL
jgi:hypothetical protein